MLALILFDGSTMIEVGFDFFFLDTSSQVDERSISVKIILVKGLKELDELIVPYLCF